MFEMVPSDRFSVLTGSSSQPRTESVVRNVFVMNKPDKGHGEMGEEVKRFIH